MCRLVPHAKTALWLAVLASAGCNTAFEAHTLSEPPPDSSSADTSDVDDDDTDTADVLPPTDTADTGDDTLDHDADDTGDAQTGDTDTSDPDVDDVDATPACVPELCPDDGAICHDGACCLPSACEALGDACGDLDDGCGGTVSCLCGTGFACEQSQCVRVTRLPDTATHACQTDLVAAQDPCPSLDEPYHGQDGNYDIRTPSYVVDPAGELVLDEYTGLRWTRSRQGIIESLDEARALCSALATQGEPLRVPTLFDVLTLIDYGKDTALIDANAFSNAAAAILVDEVNAAGVQLAIGLNNGVVGPSTAATELYTLCVHGELPARELVVDTAETATDLSLALSWTRTASGPSTWESALAHCEGLALDGNDDWRMPNHLEMFSLIASLDAATGVFTLEGASQLWTSTPDQAFNASATSAPHVRAIVPGNPDTTRVPITNTAATLCVRNTDL